MYLKYGKGAKMFIPKRVFINPKSKHTSRTKEILARIHTYAPNAQMVNLPKSEFNYQKGMAPREKFRLMKGGNILFGRLSQYAL